MMDIVELQKLEIRDEDRAPKTGGDPVCCLNNGTHHVSINTFFA